jgi:hypothetical protein
MSPGARTNYIVLGGGGGGVWQELGTVVAYSPENAIRTRLEQLADIGNVDVGGYFVAVAARSWRPLKAKIETQTVFRFDSEATEPESG